MKRQKPATFADKSLKINILTIKTIKKLEIIEILQVHTEVLQIAYEIKIQCNWRNSCGFSQWIELWSSFYHKRSNTRFWRKLRILKDLEFNCPRTDTGKYKNFFVSRKKEVKRIGKNGEEITKAYRIN